MKQQRMSLLYLKNQINPHFLYNTLDTIRIKAELNGDKEVSAMIMQMVDFFRLSVKADSQMVSVSHEIRLIQAYLKLMCCRYPFLNCEYEIDESLLDVEMPNFILQPLVENSVMHGLRGSGLSGGRCGFRSAGMRRMVKILLYVSMIMGQDSLREPGACWKMSCRMQGMIPVKQVRRKCT